MLLDFDFMNLLMKFINLICSSEDTVEEESDEDIIINAPILALSIFPPVYGKLVPPVKLTFQHNVVSVVDLL